ncbi:16.0 kDa heat shock protein, peroxisomal [Curcuma longa]|uniref:16.0 kDa heat shock protein, peroxisomal n=1 Tax=Curcuma longa TaxID=136217 RepID=UPI003D9F9FB8
MAESSFFGDPFRRLLWSPLILAGSSSLAAMDWLETPSAHIFKIDLPGFGSEDVKVQLEEGNVLSVRAEAKQEEKHKQKEAVWHVAERERGSFARRIALPENVRAEQIKAQVENGVLTVVVPKEPIPAKPKPRTIAVTSKL